MTEIGPRFVPGPDRVALVHPTPYRAAMASLGYQWVLQLLRGAGLAAERVFLPEDGRPPRSLESHTPLSRFPLIAVSIAWELELADLLRMLEASGIPPLAADRSGRDPVVLVGGPLTFSNPTTLAPFVDAFLLGEADHTAAPAARAFFDADSHAAWLQAVADLPGGWVPTLQATPPLPARAPDTLLPARSAWLTPDSALPDMFLVEGERGCHRSCAFCVMRRGGPAGGMRTVAPAVVTGLVPAEARRVGLVGAAISDHPGLAGLLEELLDRGLGVGISSLRADRVARVPRLAELLRRGGLRTLTVALDAASARLRDSLSKGIDEAHLRRSAELVREHGYERLKVYMILGVPGETDADVDELVGFALDLARTCRVTLGVSPFVAKRHTPLDGAPFAGIKTVDRRVKRLRRGLKGRVELRDVSARWAWVEHRLSQGGPAEGLAVLEAVRAGGRFAAWRKALG